MHKSVYEFISKQTNDPIIERRTCRVSGEEFAIFQSDLDFYEKISPTIAGKKYNIPLPTLCPQERQRRRLARRNERKLYRRKCDATGKDIISIYPPGEYRAYHMDQRFSDSRDGINYGIKADFSISFFQQFKELFTKVPKRALTNGGGSENSEYTNGAGRCKSCYLIFNSIQDENCYYGNLLTHSTNCIDNLGLHKGDNLYECIDCTNCYKSSFLHNCEECKKSSFLKDCKNCDACFACVNLCNKQNYIFNTPYDTKEVYEQKLSEIMKKGFSRKEFQEFCKKYPVIHLKNINIENCIGDNIYNSKDAILCFENYDSNNIKNGYTVRNTNDCADIASVDGYAPGGCYKLYESGYIFYQSSNIFFSLHCRNNCHNLFYCIECRKCENCFACTGLRDKSYCILNTQYTKAEYEQLVPKIIEYMRGETSALGAIKTGERGELFDASLSPFAYNGSSAQDYMPLTREQAIARGYKWQENDFDPVISAGITTLTGDQIPSDITICEVSKRPFRIIKQELDFYRKHDIALPRKHPDIRHLERLSQRPGRELYLRNCDKCGIEILSVYQQASDLIVYCEQCYNNEVYG